MKIKRESTSHQIKILLAHEYTKDVNNEPSYEKMGLNIPMLNLDTWNTVGQFSPPIGGERNHLRVPLPMSFSASQNDSSYANAATRSLFGSSNSDLTSSPQKPMDTTDIDEKDEKPDRPIDSTTDDCNAADTASTSTERAAEGGSSPIPNTNTREAHKNQRQRVESRDQDDLDIKQELVDFFHAPHPPAPPGSSRSYSSAEENHRLGGGIGSGVGVDSEDFAQDLRVSAAAAAAAAAKGLDFSQFVLPPRNLRCSSDSMDEKYSPLNMRKLSTNAGGNTSAGHMLMSSLLSSGESAASEDNASGRGGVGGGGSGKNGSQDTNNSSSAAAAAAAALYAESLNRDDCDFIGSNVSLKLRSMDRTQRIIAEKLISEVLFYGQFNELERSARIQPK